jgi:hypothetical protein
MKEIIDGHARGTLGESKVLHDLTTKGNEVFKSVFDGSSVDFIMITPEGETKRIEVKTTTRRNPADTGWLCHLKSTGNSPLKKDLVDILAVYIKPIDVVMYFPIEEVKGHMQMTIADTLVYSKEILKDEPHN